MSQRSFPLFSHSDINGLSTFILLLLAGLVAYQMRVQVPLGSPLVSVNQTPLLAILSVLALMTLITSALARLLPTSNPLINRILGNDHPFRYHTAVLTMTSAAALLLPGISRLFVVYSFGVGAIIGIFSIALPRRLYPAFTPLTFAKAVHAVWQRRSLLRLWVGYNIQTRYNQRVLGILWIILLPLATSLVLAFAFQQFMRVSIGVPFIAFYMSALVPYNFFSNNMFNSTTAILGRVSIITQVYFPREILILLVLAETLIDFLFAFAAMLVINLFVGVFPNGYYLFLPLLFVLLAALCTGLMLLLSVLTVLIRDIPQFLSVALQLLFFLTPIIYPVEQFPSQFRFLFVLNPVAPIVQAFRDVIAFGRSPDLLGLCFPLACAVVLLLLGYAAFLTFENEMTDLL
ncbi:MAG: ABC transporter permease [Anaerolineae bacterium]